MANSKLPKGKFGFANGSFAIWKFAICYLQFYPLPPA